MACPTWKQRHVTVPEPCSTQAGTAAQIAVEITKDRLLARAPFQHGSFGLKGRSQALFTSGVSSPTTAR
jgi:hypothetical protein